MPQYGIGRHEGSFDKGAQRDILNSMGGLPQQLTGAADALDYPNCYVLNGSGADLMTLATPKAGDAQGGGDDGKFLTVIDAAGQAHTITTAANIIVNGKKTLTFNGTKGSFVELMAWNGIWIVLASSGINIT